MKTFNLCILLAGILIDTDAMGQTTNNSPTKLSPDRRDAVASNVRKSALGTAEATEIKTGAFAVPGSRSTPASGEQGLRFNFRGVPLDTVLNYMSQAAGFIIVMETKVEGKVDAWSQQPLSKEEAVELLDTILGKNGYAVLRNGRTLTIVPREEAKKRNIPVQIGSDPASIPKTERIVTQILPVKYANATQMTKDLLPLLPTYASMTANESGNALVITDTQTDIKRMAQIVKALDNSIAGISSIQVFSLRFTDAKDLATIIKELYPTQNTSGNTGGGSGNNMTMPFGMVGMGRGNAGYAGGAAQATGQSEARQAASRVTAVADERTNSLVIGAPDALMPTIEQLIAHIDTNAEQITELRVFRLKHADPVEMTDLLSNLFPDETKTDTDRSTIQFRGNSGTSSDTSSGTRARKQMKVSAVADQRTASVIVSAASELMPHIAGIVAQLDADPAKKQRVFVYSLNNAAVTGVQQVLQDMFGRQDSGNTSASQNSDPLANRSLFNQGTGANGMSSGSTGASSTSGSRRGN